MKKGKITCNCKKSRVIKKNILHLHFHFDFEIIFINIQCLKLYCECFAAGETCKDCNCVNCANINENEEERGIAMSTLLERNPNAFDSKIAKVIFIIKIFQDLSIFIKRKRNILIFSFCKGG